MALVLGVGIGLFLIAFVWGLSLFLFVAFSRATGAISNIGIGTILFAALFTVILLVLPREEITVPFPKIYDYSIIYRSLLIAACGLFVIIGLVFMLIFHVMEPVYAKPLRRLRH